MQTGYWVGTFAGRDVSIFGRFFSRFGRWSDSRACSPSLQFGQKRLNERMHPYWVDLRQVYRIATPVDVRGP